MNADLNRMLVCRLSAAAGSSRGEAAEEAAIAPIASGSGLRLLRRAKLAGDEADGVAVGQGENHFGGVAPKATTRAAVCSSARGARMRWPARTG